MHKQKLRNEPKERGVETGKTPFLVFALAPANAKKAGLNLLPNEPNGGPGSCVETVKRPWTTLTATAGRLYSLTILSCLKCLKAFRVSMINFALAAIIS